LNDSDAGVGEILAEHQILALATSYADEPWVSNVFFAEEVSDETTSLYFATLKPSRKWRHLNANPKVSFAVGDPLPSRWLQGRGTAAKVEDPHEKDRIHSLISAKSPAYKGFVSAVEFDVFRIEVGEIRVVDLTGGTPRVFWKRS
jgi:general stress protein 26